MLNRFRLWLRTVLFRRRLEREMQEEMAVHLVRSTERLIASGIGRSGFESHSLRQFSPIGADVLGISHGLCHRFATDLEMSGSL